MSTTVMDQRIVPETSEELGAIHRLLARLDSGEIPDVLDSDVVLERGFGRLMALKAEVRLLRAEGNLEPSATRAIAEIDQDVSRLSESLTELRVRVSPDGASRIGYGFVLPKRRERESGHS